MKLVVVVLLFLLVVTAQDTTFTWTACTSSRANNKPSLNVALKETKDVKAQNVLFQTSPPATPDTECATAKVLLNYNSTSDAKIVFFVKRFLADRAKRQGILILLSGGPGNDGRSWDLIAPQLMLQTQGKYDIYAPDHRGTGNSERLYCAAEEQSKSKWLTTADDLAKCHEEIKAKYGAEGVSGFSTTNAARDILELIKAEKQSGDKVVMLGVSYGTFLLNRILQLNPDAVDAVVADSVMSPTAFSFVELDRTAEIVGRNFTDLCEATSECQSKFSTMQQGGSVQNALKKAFERQNSNNPCLGKLTPTIMRQLFFYALHSVTLRKVILPIVYRINRCSSGDIKVLDNAALAAITAGLTSSTSNLQNTAISRALQRNIACAELVTRPLPSQDELLAEQKNFPPFFNAGKSMLFATSCDSFKDNYYRDPLSFSFATFNKPMLSLHGTLDPQTSFQQAITWSRQFNSPNHLFLPFTNAVGNIMIKTPLVQDTIMTCGMKVISSFLNSLNTSMVDSSCIRSGESYDSPTLDFFPQESAGDLFYLTGVVDLWEGAPAFARSESITIAILVAISLALVTALCLGLCCCFFINVAAQASKKRKASTRARADAQYYSEF